MNVYMFIFMAGYVYVGPENRLLYKRQRESTVFLKSCADLVFTVTVVT